jgi:hypothetical protein
MSFHRPAILILVILVFASCGNKKSRDAATDEHAEADVVPDLPGETVPDGFEDPIPEPVTDPVLEPDAADMPVESTPDGDEPDLEDVADAEDEEIGCTGPSSRGEVRVTNDSSYSWNPSIAWSGSLFGLAWRENRDGNEEVYFARVSDAGAKIGSDVRITNATGSSLYPTLAWSGSLFGVGWYDTRDGDYETYFGLVDADGSRAGTDERISYGTGYSMHPSVVWTGSEYGMAWRDERDDQREIYFARISADGARIGSEVRITTEAATSDNPSLAWTGSTFGVAWNDYRDANEEIYLALVSDAGVKLGSDVRITTSTGSSIRPALVWTGSEFGVGWQDNRDGNPEIYLARISDAGVKVGTDVRVTTDSSASYKPDMTWTGSEYALVWYDYRDGNTEIYLALVSADGVKASADLRITADADTSEEPDVAWSGSTLGVTWWDDRDGNYEIYFALIDPCP